jgi:hypothetical protein
MAKKDKFWPQRDVMKEGFKGDPERAQQGPNTRPVLNNRSGLSLDLVGMVAEGTMDPTDAIYRKFERESAAEFTSEESFSDCFSEDDEDDEEDDYTKMDDDDSQCTFDEDEMAEILGSIGSMKPVAWSSKSSFELPKF